MSRNRQESRVNTELWEEVTPKAQRDRTLSASIQTVDHMKGFLTVILLLLFFEML